MVKPPVEIEVCPVVRADLFNGSFINSVFPQYFFLGFLPIPDMLCMGKLCVV